MDISELANRPWMLLPGTLCTAAVFEGLLNEIGVPTANRHSVTLDRPSIDAYCSDFNDVTQETVVCGFSLGAIVAAHYADKMAAHTLILFGVNPHADDPGKAQGRHDLATEVLRNGGGNALRARGVEVYGATPARTREQIYVMADDSAPLIDAQTQIALTRPGALPALRKARIPVMALTGSLDRAAPPPQGLAAARSAPGGQFAELNGLGHFALLEDPKACASALLHLTETRNVTT